MNDPREYILLLIAITVPLVLLRTGRNRLLLGWVCITLFIQILDTSVLTNLPAGRIVGILYLPKIIKDLREYLGLRPVRLWLYNYSYLLILGIIFGFILPWPDSTMMRPFTLTAPGRAIIYSVRLLTDFSLAVFVANQFRRPGTSIYIMRALIFGATVSAVVGILYMITGFDLAYAINGFEDQLLTADRAHGLSAEPRGLGLACAYGIMFLLIGQSKVYKYWPILAIINLIALLASSSTSALALLIAGVITGWVFFSNRVKWGVLASIVFMGFIVYTASIILPEQYEIGKRIIYARIDPETKLSGIPPGSLGQEIAYRLDAFDSSALLFMLDQPRYALIGTGPGMVSLPASYYVPPGLYSAIWTPEVGINSPPFHGILLEVSNSGVLGILLWIFQVLICWRSIKWLSRRRNNFDVREDLDVTWAMFVIGAIFYIVQVSISPVWSVMLGTGWAMVFKEKYYKEISKEIRIIELHSHSK